MTKRVLTVGKISVVGRDQVIVQQALTKSGDGAYEVTRYNAADAHPVHKTALRSAASSLEDYREGGLPAMLGLHVL